MLNQLIQLCRRILFYFRRDRFDRELEEEMKFHLEMKAEANLTAGMSMEEAHYAARRRFGNQTFFREISRETWGFRFLETLWQDFRYSVRMLRKSPIFFLTAVLTLAAGIGANTAIFTLLHGLFLRDLPVLRPAELARINLIGPLPGSESAELGIPWRMYQQLHLQQQSFTDLSAWVASRINIRDGEGVLRMYPAIHTTGNAFEVLSVKPYLGRMLTSSDDVRGGSSTGWPAVLSYGFWYERFGGDPQIIGKQIEISNTIVTVVGVTPPEFQGVLPGESTKIYLPLQFLAVLFGKDILDSPTSGLYCRPIGRLKSGINLTQANAEMSVYQPTLIREFLSPDQTPPSFIEKAKLTVSSARTGLGSFLVKQYWQPLILMQCMVAVVLLLCCVNVGGLMMSTVYSRRHEFAVRMAMGAGRWRLTRQYLTESFVIAAAGATLGAAAAWYGIRLLLAFFIDPNRQEGLFIKPDNTSLLITSLFAVLTTLLFGAAPAWHAGRSDPGTLLKSRTTLGGRKRILGRAFVPIQVALSVALVASAGLLSQSLIRIRAEQVGFDIGHITITCSQFYNLPQKGDALLDLYQRMVDRLEQLPGIQSAAATWYTPMTNSMATAVFQATGSSANSREDSRLAWNQVGPGYFRTMQIRILAGREFERNERDRSVCILNKSAASHLFPQQVAIGQYVRSNDPQQFPQEATCRVIGLAEDAKYASAREQAPRTIYFPLNRSSGGALVFLMRSDYEATAAAAYRRALAEIAPTTALLRFATLQRQMDDSLGQQRLITLMSQLFGGLALFLSALGLYGLLSSSVAQRTGEIGVRIALGAQRGAVLRMILYEALRLLTAGVILGSIALLLTVRLIQGLLYAISPFDPTILFATVGLLGCVILVAAFIPALRAAAVDPIQALRLE
ncbi:MAG TPA: ABC transporter permease [Blastocatellia bacterium]|nr:ABC transporter permease [Blastocatellia bacterium]